MLQKSWSQAVLRNHKPKILISACLLGEAVRYDGGHCLKHLDEHGFALIQSWQAQGLLLPLCPEVSGGLPVPRPAAEILGNSVRTREGVDVTAAFKAGANKALALCQQHQIQYAILKQGSPSCGNFLINDGSFQSVKIQGTGITASLLQRHGIQVFNETELPVLEQSLNSTKCC